MMCRLYVKQDSDFANEALWPQQFDWLREKQEAMLKFFTPIVKDLSAGGGAQQQ